MRIVAAAIVIVIAVAVTTSGCSGSSGSSSSSPYAATQPVTQKTAAAPTSAVAAPTQAASNSERKALPAHLVGRSLDVAEVMLHSAGISYKVIPLHGHLNDAATRWGVCEVKPIPNITGPSPVVDLVVAQLMCGGR